MYHSESTLREQTVSTVEGEDVEGMGFVDITGQYRWFHNGKGDEDRCDLNSGRFGGMGCIDLNTAVPIQQR